MIHCRAETALAHLLEPESVIAFHINYPDPWFKKKHQRRRLIKPATLAYMASRLVEGGELRLATDIREYAEMAHEALSQAPGLDNQFEAPWVTTSPGAFAQSTNSRAIAKAARALLLLRDAMRCTRTASAGD